MRLFLTTLLLVQISLSSFAEGPSYDKIFIKYIRDSRTLHKKCFEIVPKGAKNLVFTNTVQCAWRKDQLLLKKNGLLSILYDNAYDRYSSLFNIAKNIDIQIAQNPTQKNTVRLIKSYNSNVKDIGNDYFNMMAEDIFGLIRKDSR